MKTTSDRGSVGKHDWTLGDKSEDGFPIFVDDRQLAYHSSAAEGREHALKIIERLVVDGDHRLNDRPAEFLPPRLEAMKMTEMLPKDAGSETEYPALIHMHGPTVEARVLQLEQCHLLDFWIEALHAKDPGRIEATRSKYDENVQSLLTHLGQDAPCNFVDSDLWSNYSDLFKSLNGYRPKVHLNQAEVQRWFKELDGAVNKFAER